MMSGKKRRLVNQESRESYGYESTEGATKMFQGIDKFVRVDNAFEAAHTEENAFEAACSEESVARDHFQRAGNLVGHATGTANDREEDGSEGNVAGNCTQPARIPAEQATGEVKTIFSGGHTWGNESGPTSAPHTLKITRGVDRRLTQQTTTLPAGGNVPRAGTTSQDLHRAVMGGDCTLHSTVVGGNGMGGATGTAEAPAAGEQQGASRGSTG